MKFKKKKLPYNYNSNKGSKDAAKISPADRPNILYDNYYQRNDSIFSTEQMILATSKKAALTIEPSNYDTSAIETGRIKSTFTKGETLLRSAASIIDDEDNRGSKNRKRLLSNTPMGDARSSSNFQRIMNSYSSKGERRKLNNAQPWSSSLKILPKQSGRYSRISSKDMLAQAYKAIPKQTIMNKKNYGSRRSNWSKKRFKPHPNTKYTNKEDQTIGLLLKQLNRETNKLPNVSSRRNIRGSSNLSKNRKFVKKVSSD